MDNTYKRATHVRTHTRTHTHTPRWFPLLFLFLSFFLSFLFSFLSFLLLYELSYLFQRVGSAKSTAATQRNLLLFRVSHDTLVHRDTTSVVRRVSETKTDCERSARLWLLLVVTIVSKSRQRCQLREPRRRKTYLPRHTLHRAQRTALRRGEPDHTTRHHSPLARFLAHCPRILTIHTRINSFYLLSAIFILMDSYTTVVLELSRVSFPPMSFVWFSPSTLLAFVN